jgi:Cu2+-exporting ATPase
LERLASINYAVFDKTGTLTLGKPTLTSQHTQEALQLAASLAACSKHPLSKALQDAFKGEILHITVTEHQGLGLEAEYQGNHIRMGKRSWCTNIPDDNDATLELWLAIEGREAVRFTFADALRSDAKQIILTLTEHGIKTSLLSGDRQEITSNIAGELGITEYQAALTPLEKTSIISNMMAKGESVLMVGDGLNDAPSLSSATISMSPTSAMDITQNAADIVFQGDKLQPVLTAWQTACFSQKLVQQNFVLAIGYNIIAIPLAVLGYVTPLVAAIAMSSSSLIVIANAMRLNRKQEKVES